MTLSARLHEPKSRPADREPAHALVGVRALVARLAGVVDDGDDLASLGEGELGPREGCAVLTDLDPAHPAVLVVDDVPEVDRRALGAEGERHRVARGIPLRDRGLREGPGAEVEPGDREAASGGVGVEPGVAGGAGVVGNHEHLSVVAQGEAGAVKDVPELVDLAPGHLAVLGVDEGERHHRRRAVDRVGLRCCGQVAGGRLGLDDPPLPEGQPAHVELPGVRVDVAAGVVGDVEALGDVTGDDALEAEGRPGQARLAVLAHLGPDQLAVLLVLEGGLRDRVRGGVRDGQALCCAGDQVAAGGIGLAGLPGAGVEVAGGDVARPRVEVGAAVVAHRDDRALVGVVDLGEGELGAGQGRAGGGVDLEDGAGAQRVGDLDRHVAVPRDGDGGGGVPGDQVARRGRNLGDGVHTEQGGVERDVARAVVDVGDLVAGEAGGDVVVDVCRARAVARVGADLEAERGVAHDGPGRAALGDRRAAAVRLDGGGADGDVGQLGGRRRGLAAADVERPEAAAAAPGLHARGRSGRGRPP